ncbi:MAG: hypothetical protein J6S09_04045 [Paludibacteraceae bacterium]|nr:hypothetical protein [Paludibacteraceae bacterium]
MLLLCSMITFAQTAKKPTIMVIPSDHWCTSRYFTKVMDNQGKKVTINDYEAAFREDAELYSVAAKIGEIMAANGYPVKDYMQEYKSLMDEQTEEVTMSSMGSMIEETPLDMLRSRVKYDIELRVDWMVHQEKNGRSVSVSIAAIDTYSNKQVAAASGTCNAADKIIARLIEDALNKQMGGFTQQLNNHFADLTQNGREITLQIRVWDSGSITLEDENAEGVALIDMISSWVEDNTVAGAFNLTSNTESRAKFEQVRIPMLNAKGRAMDARMFANQLRQYLKTQGVDSKVMNKGLGDATLILGEK